MKGNGKMINKMDMEKKRGKMVLITKEISSTEKKKEQVSMYGLMVQLIMVNLKIMLLMGKENIYGKMEGNIMVIG